jgi:acetyltransferase-like isoleucine patch superfamily enzyme
MLRRIALALAFYGYNGLLTHFPFYAVRHAYLRLVLRIRIGSGSSVHMGCFITGRNISIGENSVINRNCYLDGRAGLSIGDRVSISPECYLLSLTHDVHSPEFATLPKPVVIREYAWLGARCVILPGTVLEEGTVVAASAVVTRTTEPYSIMAGIPARKIGERKKGLVYAPSYFPLFNTDVTL